MTRAHWAILPAAGVGWRMGVSTPKQYLPLAGRTVIEHTLQTLINCPLITGIMVVVDKDDSYWPTLSMPTQKPLLTCHGGSERCHSVVNGLQALSKYCRSDHWVLVHDAARPCLRQEDLIHLINSLADDPCGGILATPVRDTMKRATENGHIQCTVDRSNLWHALTPQMFRFGLLKEALESALRTGFLVTDEASAMEQAGHSPRLILGHNDNIKVTHPEDLDLAERTLWHRLTKSSGPDHNQ